MSANDSPQPLPAIFHKMLRWYDGNARDLVWRTSPAARRAGQRPDPFRVWMSEIMLQQTGVTVVGPRFARFLARFPTIHALAAAPRDDVAAEWAGLGYYARLRNLHDCARILVRERDGNFPEAVPELQALPGIGPYTARAIAAIAFDAKVVPADGNIARIVARLQAIRAQTPAARQALLRCAEQLAPGPRPGDFAQGLMDLGAGICTPRSPDCQACPIADACAGRRSGRPEDFPGPLHRPKKPRRFGACFIIRWSEYGKEMLLLRRRPDKGLLGGLWTAPLTDFMPEFEPDSPPDWTMLAPIPAMWQAHGSVRHSFTHFDLELAVFEARLSTLIPGIPAGDVWINAGELASIAMPRLMLKALALAGPPEPGDSGARGLRRRGRARPRPPDP